MDSYTYSSAEAGPSRSASTPSLSFPDPHNQAVFDEFEAYPFSDDPDFKDGLPTVIAAIRGTKRSAAQIDEMIGRAQWFYFTRLKNVSIPWESYAAYSTTQQPAPARSASSSSSGSNTLSRRDPLAVLNNLAEAKRMMSTGSDAENGESRMSFAMLTRLISEGRAGEVPVRQIPEGLNDTAPSESTFAFRPKPWELQAFDSPSPPFPPRSYSQSSLPFAYPNLSASSFTSTSSASYSNSPHMGLPSSQYPGSPPLMGIANNQYTSSPPLMGISNNQYTGSPPLMGLAPNHYAVSPPSIGVGPHHLISSNDFFAPHGFTSSPGGSPRDGHGSVGPSSRGGGVYGVEGEQPGSSRST